MDNAIIDFLKKQTVASVCCVNGLNEPYAFSCFFAFNATDKLICFKSVETSYHSKIILQNPKVSGTILPDKLNKLVFKGVQFTGEVLSQNDPMCKNAPGIYYSKFPYATAMHGIVWTIKVDRLKLSGNHVGIIKKLSWERV